MSEHVGLDVSLEATSAFIPDIASQASSASRDARILGMCMCWQREQVLAYTGHS